MFSQAARQIFSETLLQIDAKDAINRAVRVEHSTLFILENEFETDQKFSIYVAAIGKAAYPLAVGFNKIAGKFVKGGIVSGGVPEKVNELESNWQIFAGGHPLPNEESFAAARACLKMLEKADKERALVIFLISGGGSAMLDLPKSAVIGLSDLRELNRMLVTSGAAIAEINAVRRAVSIIKGGGLARSAPNAKQISLIISDTSAGDISSVASGPSLPPAADLPDATAVIEKYGLRSKIPFSVSRVLENQATEIPKNNPENRAYVLLDNEFMIRQAAEIAEKSGFIVKIDDKAEDIFITDGCEKLLSRFVEFRKSAATNRPVCFISGGEFGCKVTGNGIGGRNCETVLRLSLLARNESALSEYAILSAGTDGIDGNSPAAGAAADQTLFERANLQKMNPLDYLENSDSFTFFDQLGDSIMTGATGTNVRDIRILIAK